MELPAFACSTLLIECNWVDVLNEEIKEILRLENSHAFFFFLQVVYEMVVIL